MLLAHKLLHQIAVGNLATAYDPDSMVEHDVTNRLPDIISGLVMAHKFALNIEVIASDDLMYGAFDLWRHHVLAPPFDLTWWEIKNPLYLEGFLVRHDADLKRTTFDAFFYNTGYWCDAGLRAFIDPNFTPAEGAILFYGKNYVQQEFIEDYAVRTLQHVVTACSALASKATRIETVPAPDKLNVVRAKNGKPPIFEHKTLSLPAKNTSTATHGSTHASPRLHWRRGHIRTLSNGISIGIRPTLVGLAEHGFVSKDYLIALDRAGQKQ